MGRKKTSQGLGRSIIKDRFGGKRKTKTTDSFLHTSDLNDGYDWGRLNLQSVTEQSHLDDFLATAELAGTEFTAEKLNVKFITAAQESALISKEDKEKIKNVQDQHRQLLKIPRRPKWNGKTTSNQLDEMERHNFLEWRRELSQLQEIEHLILTPFERNLDFWRQLWRVIERSDVVIQIVDARNPLLFRCEDLEHYVKEIDNRKLNMILVNKSDLLTEQQRIFWVEYFDKVGIKIAFWSAVLETEHQNDKAVSEDDVDNNEVDDLTDSETNGESGSEEDNDNASSPNTLINSVSENNSQTEPSSCMSSCKPVISQQCEVDVGDEEHNADIEAKYLLSHEIERTTIRDDISDDCDQFNTKASQYSSKTTENSSKLLSGEELIELFHNIYEGATVLPGVTTIGMVGYPNVGKSSTINAILTIKKVPVSATPGRTKHFQTLYVDESLMLCDCPGLVMPTFVSTKAEMIVSGILPIDHLRDHNPPVSMVCHQIPRDTLKATYAVNIPWPQEGEDPNRPPTANELLTSYGYSRGYMTSNGLPDCPRSARYILKDYVKGKLLYCHPPPDVSAEEYQPTPEPPLTKTYMKMKKEKEHPGPDEMFAFSHVDKAFFNKKEPKFGFKGKDFHRSEAVVQGSNSSESTQSLAGKSWKKHGNRNRKEKLRRLHKDVDQLYQ